MIEGVSAYENADGIYLPFGTCARHDQGKMETNHLVAATFRGYIFGKAGTGHRRHHTKDVAGAVKGTDELWICKKKSYEGYPLRVEYSLTDDMGMKILEVLRIMQHMGIDYLKASGMERSSMTMASLHTLYLLRWKMRRRELCRLPLS